MKPRDLRLLPLAAAVWAGALLFVFVPMSAWWTVGGCVVGVAILVLVRRRGVVRRLPGGGGLAVLVLAALAATGLSVVLALPARERVAEWSGSVVEVTGTVTSSASIGRDGRLWFDAQAKTLGTRGRPTVLPAPVRIGIEPGDGFDLGARIRVVGEASATDAGERSALVVFASEAEVVEPAGGVFGVAASLKHAFVARSLRLPEPGAGLLPGLAVGDTRAVSAELNDDMRTSGLSHLTAVSGS